MKYTPILTTYSTLDDYFVVSRAASLLSSLFTSGRLHNVDCYGGYEYEYIKVKFVYFILIPAREAIFPILKICVFITVLLYHESVT